MKTAVEWLEEKWRNYDLNLGKSGFSLFLKQAKEMEKKEIIDAYQENMMSYTDGETYYNETFKS
jgi:hypothetical protein